MFINLDIYNEKKSTKYKLKYSHIELTTNFIESFI